MPPIPPLSRYIGFMSGTSLDGVDGVLVEVTAQTRQLAVCHIPFSEQLRNDLLALQVSGDDEIHREAQAANTLVRIYADAVELLLQQSGLKRTDITAIGVHGQTVRHRPELGYTRQINNPALLAELSGIDVIADFRSRDIAAGGQGAPLVPAYHQQVFGQSGESRVVANIGGISNISVLRADTSTSGFDTGPGNVLMDAWINLHLSKSYDDDGAWAQQGKVIPDMLARLLQEPFLALPPPKSTGRDLFNLAWLMQHILSCEGALSVDVQATLCVYTASTLVAAILLHAPDVRHIYICGGGAYNSALMSAMREQLLQHGSRAQLDSTVVLGVSPNHVEALAFAWLAQRFTERLPGNLPLVTGAAGGRILGALYPA